MSFDHVLPIRPPRAVPPLLKCVLSPATTLQLKALTFLIIALSPTKADKMPEIRCPFLGMVIRKNCWNASVYAYKRLIDIK